MIMRDAYNALIQEKTTILHDLVKIYSGLAGSSRIKEDIAKLKVTISDLQKRKDKLLDLSIKGHLSDEEFVNRNQRFNGEIESLLVKIAELEEEDEKSRELSNTVESLRQMIAGELRFEEGFDASIVNALLDKIVVHKTGNKKIIDLQVFFKVLSSEVGYRVSRGKNTSVCSTSHI
jgi:DNA repair exonuclease SbcCD ATPase subunit